MIEAYAIDSFTAHFDTGEDKWGQPNATLDVSLKGYFEWKTHWVRDLSGEMVVSRGFLYIKYDTRDFTHKDEITFNSIRYKILDIKRQTDFSQNHQDLHLA